jgi:2-oxoglutarate dehydrogenase E1 component
MTDTEQVLDSFRRWGYLQADLDPLGSLKPEHVPELDLEGEEANHASEYYCRTIGVEFMHIPDANRRKWIQQKIDCEPPAPDRQRLLERLITAEVFEQVLQSRYPGTKRFSLEGLAALIPLLDEILNVASESGVMEAVFGMSHRGRLNVMVHIIGTLPVDIFAEFEDVDPRSVLGGGDVKYHIGATGEFASRNGKRMQVRIVSGPSHLEAVDPVMTGRVRAKQTRIGKDGTRQVLPVLIHGDAGFAGQGIAAETLNLANLDGFSVGGTIHIVANNLIGFTAGPEELFSSRFSTDIAKRLSIPIFHVNAEDPDAVVRVGRIASEYRSTFSSDVVVDLIGYRRHGHSEIDDPTTTQPLLYDKILSRPPLWQLYSKKFGLDAEIYATSIRKQFESAKEEAGVLKKNPQLSILPDYWGEYQGGPYKGSYEVDTAISSKELGDITSTLSSVPEGFAIHPKVKRVIDRRGDMAAGKVPVDFGMAELIAFGSLLFEGMPVRLSGQDSRRATFAQRQAVYIDIKTLEEYIPLAHVSPGQSDFEIYNSMLSEAAVLGFEYGFSRDFPEALVLWEAQFGDFANGAQVIIDQFISAGEDKWGLLSGLVLLLPHGYEGQGPEHSSARIERFLQLAAEDNIQVCQPSNAVQYFHLLRRQALRSWRKPLIVFTPKSMLRLQDAASPLADFTRSGFLPVLPDSDIEHAGRIILCSGKIGRELRAERQHRKDSTTAIVFIEQLYPFPEKELLAELKRHSTAREIIWIQEEPANMGALNYIFPLLQNISGDLRIRTIKRSASASPATGSAKAHELEQKALMSLAFGNESSS